jgi:hypothetical protein
MTLVLVSEKRLDRATGLTLKGLTEGEKPSLISIDLVPPRVKLIVERSRTEAKVNERRTAIFTTSIAH